MPGPVGVQPRGALSCPRCRCHFAASSPKPVCPVCAYPGADTRPLRLSRSEMRQEERVAWMRERLERSRERPKGPRIAAAVVLLILLVGLVVLLLSLSVAMDGGGARGMMRTASGILLMFVVVVGMAVFRVRRRQRSWASTGHAGTRAHLWRPGLQGLLRLRGPARPRLPGLRTNGDIPPPCRATWCPYG